MLLGLILVAQGCYLVKQGHGQIQLRLNQVSLNEAVEQETKEKIRHLLLAVPKIKAYAVARIGLQQNENYTAYYATSNSAITFVVTACKKTELIPHTWWFPILGSVPYKGFFEKSDALALARELQQKGLDTWVFGAVAYSTLGWFDDPVTTPMLRRGYYNLVETIIHEMTHSTLYIKGQGQFNEQLASFVAQKGTVQYFREFNILSDASLIEIKEKRDRKRAFSLIVKETIPSLDELYDSELPFHKKMAERERIFSRLTKRASEMFPGIPPEAWKFNNARILQYRRYESDAEFLNEIWQKSEQQWDRFWVNVRGYAREKYNYTS